MAAPELGAMAPGEQATVPSGRRRPASRLAVVVPALVGIGAFVGSWQLVAVHNPYLIPTVAAIARSLWDEPGLYASNTLQTLGETAIGFVVSCLVAFSLAVVMTYSRLVERMVMPLAVVLSVTPIIAITTGLVVAFGPESTLPRYLIAALVVFFPLLVNALIGLRSIDPAAHDFLVVIDASRSEILWRLRVPSSLPFVFAAFRIAAPLSLTGAVVAEFLAPGHSGLGSLMETSQNYSMLAQVYGSAVLLAALGLLLSAVVVTLERLALSWHPSRSGR